MSGKQEKSSRGSDKQKDAAVKRLLEADRRSLRERVIDDALDRAEAKIAKQRRRRRPEDPGNKG